MLRACHRGPAGGSPDSGSPAGNQDKVVWTLETLPTQWHLPAPVGFGVQARALDKRSTCELEVDACVEHVINRGEVRAPALRRCMQGLGTTCMR